MAQQSSTGNFYIPSDVLEDDDEILEIQMESPRQNNVQYHEEVNNMLATIMETNREMESTGKDFEEISTSDLQEFYTYQEKYPQLVKKLQKKFNKFNLTTSQLLKFIKIEQKFIKIPQQIPSISQQETTSHTQAKNQQEIRKSRKNLVEVHGILARKKPYQLNPRMYH